MVEAGGVEPPSEKARNEETTCVARFCYLVRRLESRARVAPNLVRLISSLGSGQKPAPYPTEMTLTDQPVG